MECKDYSQHGESKVLHELANLLGINKGTFLDIGAGDGFHLSNTNYFKQLGWNGESFDIDNKGNNEVIERMIDLSNMPNGKVDLLSLDIDGNDYWILEQLLLNRPKIICFEINSQLPLGEVLVMPYDECHIWDGSHHYGMSFMAACLLLESHNYMIYDVVSSTNIIATRKEYGIKPKPYTISHTYSHPEINFNFTRP